MFQEKKKTKQKRKKLWQRKAQTKSLSTHTRTLFLSHCFISNFERTIFPKSQLREVDLSSVHHVDGTRHVRRLGDGTFFRYFFFDEVQKGEK